MVLHSVGRGGFTSYASGTRSHSYEAINRPWAPQRNTAYWSPAALITPESSPIHIKFPYIRFALYNRSNTLLRDCTMVFTWAKQLFKIKTSFYYSIPT